MGLLDFISKSSTTQGDDQSASVNPSTQQTQTQQGFSNVQYPIPATSQQTSSQFSQYAFDPNQTKANEIPNQEVPDITDNSNLNFNSDTTQLQNQTPEIEDLSKYALPQNEFDAYGNYINKEETIAPVTTQNSNLAPVGNQQLNVPETQVLSDPMAVAPNLGSVQSDEQSTNSIQSETVIPQPVASEVAMQPAPMADIPVVPMENSTTNIVEQEQQPQVQIFEPTVEQQNLQTPPEALAPAENLELANPVTDIEVNQNNAASSGNSIDATTLVPEANNILANVAPEPAEDLNTVQTEATPVESEPADSNLEFVLDNNLKDSENTAIQQEMEDATNNIPIHKDRYNPIVEEKKEVEIEKEEDVKVEESIEKVEELETEHEFKKIKNIGFIGLNSKQFKNVSVELEALSKAISESNIGIYIDSNKAYGNDILKAVENSSSKVVAIHLKPFYSSYSDEDTSSHSLQDYTTIIYADIIERLKHFIRECDAFVIPESSGLINLGSIYTLLSLQFLYSGKNKPVVLIGNKWGDKLNQLKTSFNIDDSEMASIKIAANAQEALNILKESDANIKSNLSKSRKFFDYREDFDELEYLN